jgi:hypothetical protein
MKRLALKTVDCLAVSTAWIAALPWNHWPATSTKTASSAKSAASARMSWWFPFHRTG